MALAPHVSRAIMERYSHIRMEAKRRAVDDPSANSLKRSGEPGRTRTSNPLIKSQLLYH
jgi:hypothetical protein